MNRYLAVKDEVRNAAESEVLGYIGPNFYAHKWKFKNETKP
jgi:hypothetical protein